jgi:adenine-specific DNA-methyltransferase
VVRLMNFEDTSDLVITPKPVKLIQRILQVATDRDSIVLDSFAGSGTTAHALLKQNAEDPASEVAEHTLPRNFWYTWSAT